MGIVWPTNIICNHRDTAVTLRFPYVQSDTRFSESLVEESMLLLMQEAVMGS